MADDHAPLDRLMLPQSNSAVGESTTNNEQAEYQGMTPELAPENRTPPLLPPRRASRALKKAQIEYGLSQSKLEGFSTTAQSHQNAMPARTLSVQSGLAPGSGSSSIRSFSEFAQQRTMSRRESRNASTRTPLETLHEVSRRQPPELVDSKVLPVNSSAQRLSSQHGIRRHSSLRARTVTANEQFRPLIRPCSFHDRSSSKFCFTTVSGRSREYSNLAFPRHNQDKIDDEKYNMAQASLAMISDDPWSLPALLGSRPKTPRDAPLRRPSLTFTRLSSLDQLIGYREARQSWKRESMLSQQLRPHSRSDLPDRDSMLVASDNDTTSTPKTVREQLEIDDQSAEDPLIGRKRFRHFAAEIGFCFTIAMTQFICEYLISGFAIILPTLLNNGAALGAGSTGIFWPAALLSLILSATLLIFARISDMYGGYYPFMLGLIWLTIWTLIPGFYPHGTVLEVSRAMQGLALAAFTPSTFTMVGSIYPEGPRRNIVLGLYGACAPLGFFAGFLAGGALPAAQSSWYFWAASGLSCTTAIIGYLSVPSDRTDRKQLGLHMDWLGAFLITSGLILTTYALSVEPYANALDKNRNSFTFPIVYAPLTAGLTCLLVAVWVEGWYADCPLLPFDFFAPRGIKPLSAACLFYFASFGVWLYNSARFFESELVTGRPGGVHGIMLSLWYTPMAVGGLLFCIFSGVLSHIIPIRALLIISGLAWVAAPLIFAVAPLPLQYWSEVMPSMVCGTLGIDLTYTVTTIVMSSSQPLKYQGIAGAVTSILVNLAMSFSLPISLIVEYYSGATAANGTPADAVQGYRAAFLYGAISAAVGLLISTFFVRISRRVVSARIVQQDEEVRPRATSSEAPTLVPDDERARQDQ